LGKQWPFGTLCVNALGCLLFGFVMGFIKPEQAQLPAYDLARLTLLTGFCGAYTTYSTFAFDVFELHATRGLAPALFNIAAQLAIGLLAVLLGVGLGRLAS
jgi:CrcB protein